MKSDADLSKRLGVTTELELNAVFMDLLRLQTLCGASSRGHTCRNTIPPEEEATRVHDVGGCSETVLFVCFVRARLGK